MTGNKLRDFAEMLPKDERAALKALCEPDWDYEIDWLKKGPDGILMCRSLYYAPFAINPIDNNGEIRWLNDDPNWPEDVEILSIEVGDIADLGGGLLLADVHYKTVITALQGPVEVADQAQVVLRWVNGELLADALYHY